jgi:hypothetical protein
MGDVFNAQSILVGSTSYDIRGDLFTWDYYFHKWLSVSSFVKDKNQTSTMEDKLDVWDSR